MIREAERGAISGLPMVAVLFVVSLGLPYLIVRAAQAQQPLLAGTWGVVAVLIFLAWTGLFMVQPNTAKALLLFGDYKGTVKQQGLWWANPFYQKKAVSLRVRNFETAKLKVNDHSGNPIEIGAVVVWQVFDTAEALFEVDNYDNYVHVQSESALRGLANQYAYVSHTDGEMDLSSHTTEIAEKLKGEIQDRLTKAGVRVLEARISHLAYASEIASVMLRRQQADAVIAARARIVEGAVGMVEMALDHLAKRGVVQLDEERKAAMVSNLLVVLCAEQPTQPIVNTGTLYQ
jgi:regulator of protease activity HflC (stomatin/prohibitin superfamily)